MCRQSQIRTLHLCHSRPGSLLRDSGLNLIQMHHVSRNGTLQKNDYVKFSDSNLERFTIPGLQKHENEVHCSLETTTNDRPLFYELFIKPKLSILKCLLYTSFTNYCDFNLESGSWNKNQDAQHTERGRGRTRQKDGQFAS